MAADLIENLEAHPRELDFISKVPADWSESHLIAGEVGDYAIFARKDRNSKDWYVGGVNDATPRTLDLSFDFLDPGKTYVATIYKDAPGSTYLTDARHLIAYDSKNNPARRPLFIVARTRRRSRDAPRTGAMIRALFGLLLMAAVPAAAQTQTGPAPKVAAGTIVDLGVVQSKYTDPRRVVVWLPTGYKPHGPKYAVLYMHDGQNLFDKATAGYGKEWEIDEHLDRLIAQKKVRPTIVVGIWSTPKRLQEYVPAKAFDHLPPAYMDRVRGLYGGNPLSDGYLKFLVRDLKPRIDARFNVKTDRANTIVMGSSMGALISLYAIDEYPKVFGGAGMVSTHWPLFLPTQGAKSISDEEFQIVSSAFERYLTPALPYPRPTSSISIMAAKRWIRLMLPIRIASTPLSQSVALGRA